MQLRATYLAITTMVLLVAIPASYAAPLSEPTTSNAAAIRAHFERVVEKHNAELQLFRDVSFSHPDYEAIAYFKKHGFISGMNGSFFPDQPMTRGEFARVFAAVKTTTPLPQATARPFSDVPTNQPYSRAISYLKNAKLITGFPDGTFQPDAPVTLHAVKKILGVPMSAHPDTARLASRAEALTLIYNAFPFDRLYDKQSFGTLSTTEKDILNNGNPIRGLMVNFLTAVDQYSTEELRDNFIRIRQAGFIGVSLEIPWAAVQPQDGAITFPAYYDRFIELAESEGLWVTVLLSPHYTPAWVFKKYRDVRLYDNNRKPITYDNVNKAQVPEGAYLTFAPTSPALQDQLTFEKQSVRHYSAARNVLAIFLTNEQTFDKDNLLDYSGWSEAAWRRWLQTVTAPAQTPLPVDPSDKNFFLFQRFRQDTLNDYFNTLYDQVIPERTRFTPISHKVLLYESTAAYASHYGLRANPLELKGDLATTDIYGFSPNTYAALATFRKPIMLAETNLTGNWDADTMYRYLIYQYLQGATIQSVFRWNPGSDGNTLFAPDGTPRAKYTGAVRAARLIRDLSITLPVEPPNMGILVPLRSLSQNAADFEKHQHTFDDIALRGEQLRGLVPALLYSDMISIERYWKRPDQRATIALNDYQVIFAPIDELDAQGVNNEKMRDWVLSGGTLIIEPDHRALPNWIPESEKTDAVPGTIAFGKGKVMYCEFTECVID